MYSLDNYNGIIDNNTDSENKSEKSEDIYGKTEKVHEKESSDNRNWNCNCRNECGAEVLQKEEHHKKYQKKCFNKRVLNLLNRLINNLLGAGVLSTSAPWDADFIKDFGAANKVVMTIGPSWFGEFVIRPASSWAVPAGQITAAPMPMWAGEKINYSGEWGGGIYTVSPHSKFPKEALAFAIFMVSDKRNVVDVANPDGSKGAPTFPASAKGNALWKAKVSADKYYAADPYPAMLDASKKIFAGEKPVSYDSNSAMEGQFSNELKKSKDAQAALEAFATYATNLAKQLGYKVSTS
jgi:multiple sugar transport system substrate-binding protein